ncbi:hypothetical protein P280DRAFT_520906 [Massarina eburnea CBS 473.64]|uniref:Cation/H+ exchanger domain-containing protein n=1 Tax=Massarina eburnea CBS 473.64 TaxID=1395130 RepID=A0A6A6RRD9_9PLEO|nr:hypothetical protein P280DRAFT_520906 [Massarina eburnea CBS 473.64]
MAGAAETAPSLPYREPDIVTVLTHSSFLLLLNVVNAVLDRLVYCGLLGEVLVGIAWGTPGAQWLSIEAEEVIVQLGYLGLILLVYEGGLSTSLGSLKANLLLSSAVAVTGVTIPIGLSQSRLGVVLTSAAMMDDVVGLVMVQVLATTAPDQDTSGTGVYEYYYHQAVARILQPLFFASIGFSIPITRMFQSSIVWRGIVYTMLMTLGKTVCGLWLVRFSVPPSRDARRTFLSRVKLQSVPHFWGKSSRARASTTTNRTQFRSEDPVQSNVATNSQTSPVPKPLSLHPPLILALAMTARGDMGHRALHHSRTSGRRSVCAKSQEAPGTQGQKQYRPYPCENSAEGLPSSPTSPGSQIECRNVS